MAARRPNDLALYLRLLREARPHWRLIVVLFSLSLLATPIALLLPLPLKIAIDSIVGSEPVPAALQRLLPASLLGSANTLLPVAAVAVLVFALVDHLQRLSVALLGTYAGERLALEFRAKIFRHVQRLSLSYHDTKGAADSAYRIH